MCTAASFLSIKCDMFTDEGKVKVMKTQEYIVFIFGRVSKELKQILLMRNIYHSYELDNSSN